MAQENSMKKSHSKERKEPYLRESIILSSKRSKTTKKNSWVDKDLRKIPKKKCFEEKWEIKKKEPFESLKSTESLKIERSQNKPGKKEEEEKSVLKQACKLLRTEPLKTRRPKNKPKLKKLTSEWIIQRPKQNRTTSNKNWVKNGHRK